LRKDELPVGVEFGITYKSSNLNTQSFYLLSCHDVINLVIISTVSINPLTYLTKLLNTFTSLGGTTKRANLSHLNECIESDPDIVVNCSGIHSRTLGSVEDSDVFLMRGQTVIAQLPELNINRAFF